MKPDSKPLALIVDDEEAFLEIVSARLGAAGFSVVMAHSVPEAIQKAEELLPDIVLSDVYMPPGPSGFELALALRRNERTHMIKLAFFTSLRDPWSELQGDKKTLAVELGQISFFDKSADVEALADRVRGMLTS